MKLTGLFALLILAALPTYGETASTQLVVQWSIDTSLEISINGDGASSSMNLASFSRFQAPLNATATQQAQSWTVAWDVDVNVGIANGTSSSHTLVARLRNAAASGVTWKLNGVSLTTSDQTVKSAAAYAQDHSMPCLIAIDDAAAPGSIANWVEMTAIAD